MHCQSNKEMDGVDWESVKTKYADLRENFIERYPTEDSANDFPHQNDPAAAFTKERLVSKVKLIRQKYKVALDSGRRSGGGRVVAQFYDICSKTWGGSPAAESVVGGMDTGEAPCSSSPDEPGTSSDQCNNPQTNFNVKGYGHDEDENISDPDVSPPLKRKTAVLQETPRRDLITHLKERTNVMF